jgi:DNA-binding Lrp family transcriptional regulator
MVRHVRPENGNIAISNSRISTSSNAALDVVIQHVAKMRKTDDKGFKPKIDDMDMAVINYMLAGYSAGEIAQKMSKPLSTIQRRIKRLTDRGFVVSVVHINFKKFGLRRGVLHFKCKTTDLHEAVQQIASIKGVESASGYLGSLDIIANVVYADSAEVLDIIGRARDLNLVSDASWSEEIHSVPI